jgi:hypothetical protein
LTAAELEVERVLRGCAWVTHNDPGRLFDEAGNLIPSTSCHLMYGRRSPASSSIGRMASPPRLASGTKILHHHFDAGQQLPLVEGLGN